MPFAGQNGKRGVAGVKGERGEAGTRGEQGKPGVCGCVPTPRPTPYPVK